VVPGFSQQYDLVQQASVSADIPIENVEPAASAEQVPLVCENLGDAALILMADNWKLFDAVERLLKKKALKDFITFLDISSFLMKIKNDQKFASTWTAEEIKAVNILKDNWKEKGKIDLQTLPNGRNRVLCMDKDALSRLTDFSGESTVIENFVAIPNAEKESLAFNPFRVASTLNAANKVMAPLTVVPKKLEEAMTVGQGDGYWQVSERMLALIGEKPSNHEVWSLMKALLTAHETSGNSGQGYLKVGEVLPIDAPIQADPGFQKIIAALNNNENFAPPAAESASSPSA
jgi:hypothetical protein